jgi:hypothetical protein
MMIAQEMAPWHGGEWGFFLVANVIIFYFCVPKMMVDVRRWLRPKPR